jgi:sirohydrochlorin cobaltochelatase
VTDAALVLLGHGSRDAAGADEFLAVAAAVQAALPALPVEAGVLEFAGPVAGSISDAFQRAAARGARRVLALPVLLHFGEHGTRDMPAVVAAARERYPDAEIRLAQPLAGHDRLLDLVTARCQQAERRLEQDGVGAHTTVLLVGRGSTSARANADLYATARLFQERGRYDAVEVCFVSLAQPCVPAGLRRCVLLGASRVLVIPYFVNTGLLVRRIETQIEAARLFYPAVRVAVGAHFGPDPRLIAALVDRARGTWPEVIDGREWPMGDEATPEGAPFGSRSPSVRAVR